MSALSRLEELADAYVALLDNLGTFLLTFALAYLLGRYVVEPVVSNALELRGTDRTLREGIERVVSVAVVVLAVVLGLSVSGFDFLLQRAAILVAALTVALGFAAQHVVGNLVSGAFIVTDPAFNIGDWIRWDDEEGVIEDIDFRSTRIRTFDNEVVSVPNSELTANAVTNAVLNEELRVSMTIEINYDDDVGRASRILVDAAEDHPEILADPEPFVRVTELGEAVELASLFWIADPNRIDYGRIRSEYARTVLEGFEEAGIDLGRANPQALEGDVGVVPKTEDGAPLEAGTSTDDGSDDDRSGQGGQK